MKSVRVVLAVVALLALPFGSVAAQGRSKPKPTSGSAATDCKAEHAAALARAEAEGHAPYGLDKKCSDPVPPPSTPPAGPHRSVGVVYEDVDGNGIRDMFAGEMGLAGWTVQLFWSGQLVTSATSDADGNYAFTGLGNGDAWSVCVVPAAGYSRTQPANGSACGGNGVNFLINGSFETWFENNFGWMIQ